MSFTTSQILKFLDSPKMQKPQYLENERLLFPQTNKQTNKQTNIKSHGTWLNIKACSMAKNHFHWCSGRCLGYWSLLAVWRVKISTAIGFIPFQCSWASGSSRDSLKTNSKPYFQNTRMGCFARFGTISTI